MDLTAFTESLRPNLEALAPITALRQERASQERLLRNDRQEAAEAARHKDALVADHDAAMGASARGQTVDLAVSEEAIASAERRESEATAAIKGRQLAIAQIDAELAALADAERAASRTIRLKTQERVVPLLLEAERALSAALATVRKPAGEFLAIYEFMKGLSNQASILDDFVYRKHQGLEFADPEHKRLTLAALETALVEAGIVWVRDDGADYRIERSIYETAMPAPATFIDPHAEFNARVRAERTKVSPTITHEDNGPVKIHERDEYQPGATTTYRSWEQPGWAPGSELDVRR